MILVVVSFLVTLLVSFLPGDPARAVLGEDATPVQIAKLRAQLHLDQGVFPRYWDWVVNALHGDFGHSLRSGEPVISAIKEHIPVSLELMILGQLVAIAFAVLAGCYAAIKARRWQDRALSVISFGMISAPSFVVGVVLVYIFSVNLKWFPATGFEPLSSGLGLNLKSLVLPMIAMSAEVAGVYQRLLRSDMVRTLREDFITASVAKGMTPANIVFRQALRPSSFSLVTLVGINTARLIGGLVVIEQVFALPGMGRLLIDSVRTRDYAMVQGIIIVIATAYVVINVLIDLVYVVLDPRVRSARE
jgi:peptide/nickel transport system permease protein